MGFLILAVVIFALYQRRKYRRMSFGCDKWSRRWERMQTQADMNSGQDHYDKWDKWTRQWQEWERWTQDARHQAAEVGHKVAGKLGDAEARLRRQAERLRG